MGICSSGHPGIPAPNLEDIGTGRFGRFRRLATLERHDGMAWVPVGRYGTIHDASVPLDEAIGAGAEPDSMRVVETDASATVRRVLLIVGALGLAVAIAVAISLVFR